MFSSDVPINSNIEDELNRKNFIKILAKSILEYDKKECLIIGLMGSWGIGKTSIINMVEEYIISSNKNYPIVHFNPWNFSNQNNLLFQFFNIIERNLDKKNISIDNLKKLTKTIADWTSVNINIPFLMDVNIDPKFENNENDTLELIKFNINKEFHKINGKIIIIIDDIDRLNSSEIQQIFMLVKSLADFDNVIYILSFDKNAVIESFNHIQIYSPEIFIEKIIQIPIDVPSITVNQFKNIVYNNLNEFIKKNNLTYNKEIVFNIIFDLIPFFNNIRDVNRYFNVLNFYFNILKEELNFIDFVLITALHLFEPTIFAEIKNNKNLFLNDFKNDFDYSKKDIFDIFRCAERIPEEHVQIILEKLFPQIQSYYNMIEFTHKNYLNWRRELKICTNEHFNKYFTFSLDEKELSKKDILMLFNMNNVGRISNTILKWNYENKTESLLSLMILYINDIPKNNLTYFIESLIDIGDLLEFTNDVDDKYSYLNRIFYGLLKRLNNQDVAFNCLKNAIYKSSSSIFCFVNLIAHFDLDYGLYFDNKNPKTENECLISKDNLMLLEKCADDKLKKLVNTEKFWDNENLNLILSCWKNWGNIEHIRKCVNDFIDVKKNLLIFIKKFKFSNNSDKSNHEAITFDYGQILSYDNKTHLIKKINDIQNEFDLDVEEKRLCSSFLEGITT